MAETTRITSLNMLLDPTGKMLLAEEYGKVIENVQKNTISGKMKNTELSGDPSAGTVEAKRFANATSKNYGTARGAAKGDGVKGKPVTIPINVDKEIVEEVEQKDVSLLGVEGLIAKRTANHGAIAQPVKSTPYSAEKIPLSEAYGIELFYHYGTKSVMPDLIFKNKKGE